MSPLAETLAAIVGEPNVSAGDAIEPRHLADWSPISPGRPSLAVRPGTQAELAAVLRACNERGQPVVVQGGMTGLVGAAVPRDGECVIAMERMNRVEEIDVDAEVMVVEAGATLAALNEAAAAHGLMFPLDLGARGSCRIGGNISTNAGGNRVIRFGNTRELVLGLDVTLADGTRLDMSNRLVKNNTGYDLKHLFIGGEGTLGVVTRAVLKLVPIAPARSVAFCGVASFGAVVKLLAHVRRELGGSLSAFEVMWSEFYALAGELAPQAARPLPDGHPLYVLVETMANDAAADRALLERTLAASMEAGLVTDAVIANSEREAQSLWSVRDAVAEFLPKLRPSCGFDVSIPIRAMPKFVERTRAFYTTRFPSARFAIFGHLGDSNLHVSSGRFPQGSDDERALCEGIYAIVRDCAGSVSAEHGIGIRKKKYLAYSRTPEEIAAMRALKQVFDPKGILNPGRIF